MLETEHRFAGIWSAHHTFLVNVAYRLLGNYGDAEDAVQETFSRLLQTDLDAIEDVRAWLVVVASRICLDQLRSARVRRQAYVGPWLPEPLVGDGPADPAQLVTLDESVRMALLVVLERMSPAERVAFVLHDVFAFTFEQVADAIARSPAACRQLASRARRRLKESGATSFAPPPNEQRQVIEAFIAACKAGDIERLIPLLDSSVAGWADLGSIDARVPQPTIGRDLVARRVLQFFGPETGTTLTLRYVNGEAGVLALRGGAVFAVITFALEARHITRLYGIVAPEKLARVRRAIETD